MHQPSPLLVPRTLPRLLLSTNHQVPSPAIEHSASGQSTAEDKLGKTKVEQNVHIKLEISEGKERSAMKAVKDCCCLGLCTKTYNK